MGDLDKKRSLTGYTFTLLGCAISWKATLQSTMAFSITEAEYMTVIETVKEVTWLKGLVKDLDLHQGVTTVFYDRQSAIHLMKYLMYHENQTY